VWLTETGAKRLEAAMIVWREAQRDLSKSVSVPQVRALAKASETIGEEREEKP
jgi:hypothetical protein